MSGLDPAEGDVEAETDAETDSGPAVDVTLAGVFALAPPPVKQVVEGALLAAGGPLTVEQIQALYADDERPAGAEVVAALAELRAEYADRAVELVEVAGGHRMQVRATVAPWVARLWDERPQRYSRALLETLALIAYRQPITRGEIEDIRGVAVTTQIIKTLTERDWVRVVGHRDVPGRPALYATTRRFLDYFSLRTLSDLPSLAEVRDPAFLGDDDTGGLPADADSRDVPARPGLPPLRLAIPAAAQRPADAESPTPLAPQATEESDDPAP